MFFLSNIASLPVHYLDVSAGLYNLDKHLIYPVRKEYIELRHKKTIELAACYPRKQFILSGKASRISTACLPVNVHIGICRDLISNPDFLKNSSVRCDDCMRCHYFSRNVDSLECGLW